MNSFFPHFRPLKAVTIIAKQKVRGGGLGRVGGAHVLLAATQDIIIRYMSLSKKLTTSKDQRDLETESIDTFMIFCASWASSENHNFFTISCQTSISLIY